jgi:hypothetical protein
MCDGVLPPAKIDSDTGSEYFPQALLPKQLDWLCGKRVIRVVVAASAPCRRPPASWTGKVPDIHPTTILCRIIKHPRDKLVGQRQANIFY